MKLEVRVFSGLEKYIAGVTFGQPIEIEIPEGTTGRGLLAIMGIPEEQVFTILTNGRHFTFDQQFRPNDRVALFPPVGGG